MGSGTHLLPQDLAQSVRPNPWIFEQCLTEELAGLTIIPIQTRKAGEGAVPDVLRYVLGPAIVHLGAVLYPNRGVGDSRVRHGWRSHWSIGALDVGMSGATHTVKVGIGVENVLLQNLGEPCKLCFGGRCLLEAPQPGHCVCMALLTFVTRKWPSGGGDSSVLDANYPHNKLLAGGPLWGEGAWEGGSGRGNGGGSLGGAFARGRGSRRVGLAANTFNNIERVYSTAIAFSNRRCSVPLESMLPTSQVCTVSSSIRTAFI